MVGARPLLPLPLLLLLPAAAAKEYLFVTLFSNHSIMRMELDGSNPVALVTYPPHEMADPKAYVSWPDGVQVDVKRRKMYWTNMGDTGAQVPRSGSVWRSNLDGSGIEVVVPVVSPPSLWHRWLPLPRSALSSRSHCPALPGPSSA